MSVSTARSSCWSTTATISSIERRRTQQRLRWHLFTARPDLRGAVADARPRRPISSASAVGLPAESRSVQVRLARELVDRCRQLNRQIAELDLQLEQRVGRHGAGAARAARLRRRHRREAARRDRPDRPLPDRRAARPPQRRRTARSKLRKEPAPPARPRRQPPTQRRPLPDRDHASALPPRRHAPTSNANRAEGKSRREAHPLPQTAARPRRLQHAQSRARLDIGATLAQPRLADAVSL